MKVDFPHRVYKYVPPDRVDVLSHRQLRYTPLGAFNDPFEGRPEITGINSKNQTLSLLDGLLPEETKKLYDSLPPHAQATIPYNQVDFLAKLRAQSRGEQIHGEYQSVTPLIVDFITGKIDEQLGVLCLSEVPDSLLMWSHYSASHSGFLLEFDPQHSYFHQRRSDEDDFRCLRRVFYRDARPSANLTVMSEVELFLVKSWHWSYEREWRIVRPLSEADVVHAGQLFPVHLFSYPPDALTGVVIGARATKETMLQVRDILRSIPEFRHVQLQRAVADSTHFMLRIVDEAS